MSKVAHLSTAMASGQVALVNYSPSVGPDGRGVYVFTYEGTDSGVSNLADALLALGAQVRSDYGGGVASVVASFPFDPGADPADTAIVPPAEVPVDTYRITMGEQSVSLFALPKATREAKRWAETVGDSDNKAAYKLKIQDAIDKGAALSTAMGVDEYPFAHAIYRSISRGVTEEQVLSPTLIRTRTFSYKYNVRLRISYTQDVWTTTALVRIFQPPDDIGNTLPFSPEEAPTDGNWGTPDNATWGWKVTDQGLDYNVARREWSETVTWVFKSWDNDIYKITET
jgi:hypothetical protein